MNTFHTLTIKEVIKETKDAVSILFDIPSSLTNDFKFLAGQYVTLKTNINDEEVRRAYSICASSNSNELKVAIKAVENGLFSTYATTKLESGHTLDVSTPEGKFILKPEANKNYIGFAAGSGITPVLSMIKTTLESEPTATFTLVYGNKSIADTIFYNEIESLKHQHPSQLKVNYVLSREDNDNCFSGRINQENTQELLTTVYASINFDKAFLCGPEEMVKTVASTLETHNFESNQILFELFTAATNEEATAEVSNGESEVKVILDDEELTFSMKQTDTLLAASLRNNVDAPYSCQGGVCSSCIAKITSGKAVMSKNGVLSDEELEEGFVLTCVAHPVTNNIIVDFDDI